MAHIVLAQKYGILRIEGIRDVPVLVPRHTLCARRSDTLTCAEWLRRLSPPENLPPTPTPLTLGTMIPPISFCATLSYLCKAPIWIRRCGSSRTPMPDNTSHPSICLRPQAPGTIRRRRHPTPPYGVQQITRLYTDPPIGRISRGRTLRGATKKGTLAVNTQEHTKKLQGAYTPEGIHSEELLLGHAIP